MNSETKNFSWLDVGKSVWYFLDKDKKRFTVFFCILLTVFFYELVPIYIVGKIVDFFANYQTGQSLRIFYYYVLFISISWISVSLVRLKSKNVLSILGVHVRTRARVLGFSRLTEFSLEWHEKENTGSKMQRIFTGAESLLKLLSILRRDLLKIAAAAIGVLAYFISVDLKMFLLALLYVVAFVCVQYYFGNKMYALNNEFNELNQKASGVYVESTSNMLVVKALGGEKEISKKVFNREELTREISIKIRDLSYLKWRIFQLINGIGLGLFLLLVGQAAVAQTITVGAILVLFTYFFNRLQGSLSDIDEIYNDLIELRSNVSKMMPIFRETEFIKRGNETFPRDWKAIEIKNANMDYGSGQMGLKDFSLTLARNTKTGIAGLSGSGKSTLAKIILGLYALKSGEFKVGNRNYYSISHNETLSNITVVLQETELFNLSLRDNITMMRSGDSVLLNQAIEISQLGEVIAKLPEGLDSRIGEKGYMLSGGERQRLGIARAIYKNAPIIILDEATSSLDSETEGRIMEKLLGKYGRDKTFLIIAHRLGTLKYTDKIAVMEEGRVVEEGNYDELMGNNSSVFYRMNKEQKNAKV